MAITCSLGYTWTTGEKITAAKLNTPMTVPGITLAASSSITTAGAFGITLTSTALTNVTLPTTGTLATLAGSETLTNKTLTSPILTTPQLGTPASGNLSNCTAYPLAQLTGAGTGILTALAVNVGSAGAPILFNGAGGTPSSIVLTNATGTAASLTAGIAAAVAASGITGTTLAANVVTTSVTTVGALAAGSIVNTFGAIDVGADPISGGAISGTTGTFTGAVSGLRLTSSGDYVSNGGDITLTNTNSGAGGRSWRIGDGIGGLPGSLVFFDATGSTVKMTLTTTGLNNTVIGATTPAAGSFTTVIASGNTSTGGSLSNGAGWAKISQVIGVASVATSLRTSDGTVRQVDISLQNDNNWRVYDAISGTDRLAHSGTGLAVTGTLSATSTITTGAPTGGAGAWLLGVYTAGAAIQAGKVKIKIGSTEYDLLTA